MGLRMNWLGYYQLRHPARQKPHLRVQQDHSECSSQTSSSALEWGEEPGAAEDGVRSQNTLAGRSWELIKDIADLERVPGAQPTRRLSLDTGFCSSTLPSRCVSPRHTAATLVLNRAWKPPRQNRGPAAETLVTEHCCGAMDACWFFPFFPGSAHLRLLQKPS